MACRVTGLNHKEADINRSFIRANHKIRAPMVRCVNPDGSMVGVIPAKEALRMAQEQGFDLVEVSPNANPPVCRIMDFGKFRYDESIKEKQARKKAHKHALKEIKFHTNVGDHDYSYKLGHVREFLEKGHKVKLSLQFRGRENAHRNLGFEVVKRVIQETADICTVEMEPKMMGRTLMCIVTPRAGKGRTEAPKAAVGAEAVPTAAPAPEPVHSPVPEPAPQAEPVPVTPAEPAAP